MTDRLDEMALRRPDFRGGVPVTLADGQEWTLPRVRAHFRPDPDHEDGFRLGWDLGPEYEVLAAAVDTAESPREVIRSELGIATYLLLKNYNLAPGQVGTLLKFGYGDDPDVEAAEIRRCVMDVAAGRVPGPKVRDDG